jgi:hypothetical protein
MPMSPLILAVADLGVSELDIPSLDCPLLSATRWEHVATQSAPLAADGAHTGATLWASSDREVRGAIAWEWVELAKGVFVLANPNALVSNIRLRSEPDDLVGVQPALRRLMVLNSIVHALPWQDRVRAREGSAQRPPDELLSAWRTAW